MRPNEITRRGKARQGNLKTGKGEARHAKTGRDHDPSRKAALSGPPPSRCARRARAGLEGPAILELEDLNALAPGRTGSCGGPAACPRGGAAQPAGEDSGDPPGFRHERTLNSRGSDFSPTEGRSPNQRWGAPLFGLATAPPIPSPPRVRLLIALPPLLFESSFDFF